MAKIVELELDINADRIEEEVYTITDAVRPLWKRSDLSIEVMIYKYVYIPKVLMHVELKFKVALISFDKWYTSCKWQYMD